MGFARVVGLLDNPAVDRSALGSGDDLRTLAAGFLELSRAAAALPPATKAAAREVATTYSAADPDVVPAAKEWLYSPATKQGVPVKFRKSVPVHLSVK